MKGGVLGGEVGEEVGGSKRKIKGVGGWERRNRECGEKRIIWREREEECFTLNLYDTKIFYLIPVFPVILRKALQISALGSFKLLKL